MSDKIIQRDSNGVYRDADGVAYRKDGNRLISPGGKVYTDSGWGWPRNTRNWGWPSPPHESPLKKEIE